MSQFTTGTMQCSGQPGGVLTPQEESYLEGKLYDGYLGFEALTARQWDEGICGICGVAPVFESGDSNCKDSIPLKTGKVHLATYTFSTCIYYGFNWHNIICFLAKHFVWCRRMPSQLRSMLKSGGAKLMRRWLRSSVLYHKTSRNEG